MNLVSFYLIELASALAGFSVIHYQTNDSLLVLSLVLAGVLIGYRLIIGTLAKVTKKVNTDTTLAWILFNVVDVFIIILLSRFVTPMHVGQAALMRITAIGVLLIILINEELYVQSKQHMIDRELIDNTTGE